MPKAVDKAVRYLVYAIGWLSQGILQGNARYLVYAIGWLSQGILQGNAFHL
jgi:hypothetical protein